MYPEKWKKKKSAYKALSSNFGPAGEVFCTIFLRISASSARESAYDMLSCRSPELAYLLFYKTGMQRSQKLRQLLAPGDIPLAHTQIGGARQQYTSPLT